MSEWWTLAQVLRWIRTRDLEAVARVEDDHQDDPTMAVGMEAADLADHLGEGADTPDDGELRNEPPDALIRDNWHPADRQHPFLRTLTTAAAEGRVEVCGIRNDEGEPEPIPAHKWTALALDLIDGAAWTTRDDPNNGVIPRPAWRDTVWQADGVMKLWSGEQETASLPSGAEAPTPRRRGPTPGTTGYDVADRKVVEQVQELMETGRCRSPWEAIQEIPPAQIVGAGSEDSRRKRILTKFKKLAETN